MEFVPLLSGHLGGGDGDLRTSLRNVELMVLHRHPHADTAGLTLTNGPVALSYLSDRVLVVLHLQSCCTDVGEFHRPIQGIIVIIFLRLLPSDNP